MYRHLGWFLIIYFRYVWLAHAQFVSAPFQFESEIVDIVQVNSQRFVATANKGLYVSADGGKSWLRRWLPRELDPQHGGFWPITIQSLSFINDRLWAMTTMGMFVSDDQGYTWRRIDNPYEYLRRDSPVHTSTYHKIISQGGSVYVLEQYFDPNSATYGFRLLKSVDKGEHWSIANTPASVSPHLNATDQAIFLATFSKDGAAVFTSKDQTQSWQLLTSTLPFESIRTITASDSAIVITGYRSTKDNLDSIVQVSMLATSLDGGKTWQLLELPAVNYVPHDPRAAVIDHHTFVVALRNQIAYSTGNGQWTFDSLGLKSPNAMPEGGMAIINDTLWVGYQDFRFQTDQFALKGFLFFRSLKELSPGYISAPSLLGADDHYREAVILDWQKANVSTEPFYYSLERAEGTPDNFRPIAQLAASASSFMDKQVNQGTLYHYRIRTEQRNSDFRSTYSPVVSVAKANLCIRSASLNYFEDVQMPSTDTLFARSGSELVRSVDGGKSWSLLNPCYFNHRRYDPGFGKYISLSFPTSRVGYALVGNGSFLSNSTNNVLLKTPDGGETWTLQPINHTFYVYKILFISERIGFALVDNGSGEYTLYKTVNGGRDFMAVLNAPRFTTLQFRNGLLMGYGTGARIAFSDDLGLSWSNTNRTTMAAHIFDANRYVIGYNGGDSTYVRLTSDGGKTWRLATIDLKRYDQIHDIQFMDNQRGFIIGGGYTENGRSDIGNFFSFIYQTRDGGLTWTAVQQPDGTQGEAAEIVMQKNKIFIFYRPAGYQSVLRPISMLGTIHMSEDAGKTWQVINDLHGKKDFVFQSISYRNASEGMAITTNSGLTGSADRFFYYTTKDSGLTWLRASLNEPDGSWFVRFISPDVGFRTGNNVVYYTLDGSKSWQRVPINLFPFTNPFDRLGIGNPRKNGFSHGGNMQFLSSDLWIALSDDHKLYKTASRGQAWELMNTPTLWYPMFYFVNERVGYVTVENNAAGDQLWKTADGGKNWELVGPFDENSLFFLTETIGFAGIKRTTDGGKHWLIQEALVPAERQDAVNPNYRFVDDKTGYVGPSYYTTDGGAHWSMLTYLSENINNPFLSFVGPSYYQSNATLLSHDHYYGTMTRIVPSNIPCSPLAIEGDTTLYVDKVSTSTYSANLFHWVPSINFNWAIDGGGKLQSDLSEVKVNWTEKTNAVRVLTVKAENDCGESTPASLKIATKIVVTGLDPLSVSYTKVYPNPAQTRVMIDVDPSIHQSSPAITWYDLNGKPLSLPGNRLTGYDVVGLPAGVYLVRIQTKHYTEIKRVIITR